MRTLWLLWKLARVLGAAKDELRAAAITVVVEGEDVASYREACREAASLGESKPARRTAYEVSLWRDRAQTMTGTETKRGYTLAEALAAALRG